MRNSLKESVINWGGGGGGNISMAFFVVVYRITFRAHKLCKYKYIDSILFSCLKIYTVPPDSI